MLDHLSITASTVPPHFKLASTRSPEATLVQECGNISLQCSMKHTSLHTVVLCSIIVLAAGSRTVRGDQLIKIVCTNLGHGDADMVIFL